MSILVSAPSLANSFKFPKEFDFKGRYKINWVFMKLVEAFYFTRH